MIAHIDARGKRDSVIYDALGRVIRTITPNNDTSKVHYRSDGLVDSSWAPGSGAARTFKYHATWKNVVSVRDESNTLVDTVTVDALGRDSLTDSKTRVQVSSGTYKWQWRRVQPFFNVAGQADSSRLVRTDNCNDPCNTPTWPGSLDTDSTHVQRVRHRFDRAGRDSLRLNDRNKAVLYLYDRLGRIVSRRPWTDSMAVKDSFVYDIAGNLKKTITRRGDVITTDYDSRNRDTLSVIPGVGTLLKTFGGPLDQLTRLWVNSPVDSIGNVNAELRWGFDQRGRLKADTTYTGATVRATTYTYDTYERPSTLTDPLGTWTTRYEAARGYADTLITPYTDTISYSYDSRSRALGPHIASAGARFDRAPSWNLTGALRHLTNSVPAGTPYTLAFWDRNDITFPDDPGAGLGPVWTEQHSATAPLDSLQDSVTYDGWERVLVSIQKKNGVVAARDTFAFDRAGNLKTTAGAESYDVTTDRLLSMTVGSSTWSFRYDRAGNLDRLIKSGSNDTLTYSYDALSRLRAVRRNGTLVARYGYDVLGRRIAKRVYSSVTGGIVGYTRFTYHGSAVAFESDTTGTKINLRYAWGLDIDDLVAVRDSLGNHFYVVQDKLHSVRGLVKRDGTWVLSQRFGAYGAVIAKDSSGSGPGFAVRYGWTGREYDAETGWYFHRSRYYDPSARRFVQEDPAGYGGGSNVYQYVAGRVLEGRDPSGMMFDPDRYGIQGQAEAGEICGIDCVPLGGGGFKDWDGNGVDDFENFAAEQQVDAGQRVTFTFTNPDGTLTVVTMYVTHSDYDPENGHEKDLAERAAKAAAKVGLSSFDVYSVTCCHERGAHTRGDALDINVLGGTRVEELANRGFYFKEHGVPDANLVLHFMLSLHDDNRDLPVGAQVLGPFHVGWTMTTSGWAGANMYAINLNTGQQLGYEHRNHIHFGW